MTTLYRNFTWALDGSRQDMLVENGRVVERSPGIGLGTDRTVDLGGLLMIPAFIDAHCHILPTGLDLGRLSLAGLETKQQVLDAVRDRLPSIEPGGWLRAVHYDQTRFADAGHLMRADLDPI